MLVKSSRLFYLLLIVFVTSIFIPKYYWMKFEKNIKAPAVFFSPVIDQFLVRKQTSLEKFCVDPKGKEYSREEFETLMPLLNYRQLVLEDKLPDSLHGELLIIDKIRINNITLKIYPADIDLSQIQLFPMFESRSGRVRLEMPDDYFRIAKRMEFIDCASNTVVEKKSLCFTTYLNAKHFSFPAKMIAGNPTTKKAFDEGYFVLDSKNNLFHIKMIKGKPFCVNTNIPNNLDIAFMRVMEMPLKEYYGVIITKPGDVYLISYDNYKLIKLPLTEYDIEKDIFALVGDQFFRTISLISSNQIRTIATDRNYKIVDRYEEMWKDNAQSSAGVVASYIFPFTLKLNDENSSFSNFHFNFAGASSFIGMIIFTILTYVLLLKRKISLKKGWFDLVLVLITGIYGFIAVLLVKNVDKNLE
ncbi:MAG: DUF4857 domain-containing protein [Ignavibacteria bacterium]|nr:DUF4857 domain-containing protein [Ignavibacteria bacterium]